MGSGKDVLVCSREHDRIKVEKPAVMAQCKLLSQVLNTLIPLLSGLLSQSILQFRLEDPSVSTCVLCLLTR